MQNLLRGKRKGETEYRFIRRKKYAKHSILIRLYFKCVETFKVLHYNLLVVNSATKANKSTK